MERIARNWVRRMVAQSPQAPLPAAAVWDAMAAQIGHGPLAVGRTQTVLTVIDRQLSDHPGNAALRSLRAAASAYLQRERENLKLAA